MEQRVRRVSLSVPESRSSSASAASSPTPSPTPTYALRAVLPATQAGHGWILASTRSPGDDPHQRNGGRADADDNDDDDDDDDGRAGAPSAARITVEALDRFLQDTTTGSDDDPSMYSDAGVGVLAPLSGEAMESVAGTSADASAAAALAGATAQSSAGAEGIGVFPLPQWGAHLGALPVRSADTHSAESPPIAPRRSISSLDSAGIGSSPASGGVPTRRKSLVIASKMSELKLSIREAREQQHALNRQIDQLKDRMHTTLSPVVEEASTRGTALIERALSLRTIGDSGQSRPLPRAREAATPPPVPAPAAEPSPSPPHAATTQTDRGMGGEFWQLLRDFQEGLMRRSRLFYDRLTMSADEQEREMTRIELLHRISLYDSMARLYERMYAEQFEATHGWAV